MWCRAGSGCKLQAATNMNHAHSSVCNAMYVVNYGITYVLPGHHKGVKRCPDKCAWVKHYKCHLIAGSMCSTMYT